MIKRGSFRVERLREFPELEAGKGHHGAQLENSDWRTRHAEFVFATADAFRLALLESAHSIHRHKAVIS